MNREAAVLFWIPLLVLLLCTFFHYIPGILREIVINLLLGDECKGFTFGSVSIVNQLSHKWHLHRNEYMGVE